ncbi:MAG: TraC family protein [Alphaproteobacteria bacterium]
MLEKTLSFLGVDNNDTTEPHKPWMKGERFHNLLPYESYDEETGLFYNKGATGFVLKGLPMVGASLHDQGQLAEFFRQKEHLPEGSSLQVLFVSSPRVGHLLDNWVDYRHGPERKLSAGIREEDCIYQKLAHQRRELFKKKALGEEPYMVSTCHLLISITFPGRLLEPLEKEHLLKTRNAAEESLKKIGVFTQKLDAEKFQQEMSNLLNMSGSIRDEPCSYNPLESISKQILHGETTFEATQNGEGVLTQGGRIICKSFYPKSSPKTWALHLMDLFLGNPLSLDGAMLCPFWLHYGLTVEHNQGQAKSKVIMRRESLENSMKNRLGKWMVALPEQYEEADSCLRELNQGERVIQACFSLTIMTEPKNLSKVEARLRQIWSSCGWESTPTTYDHLAMMIGSLPMTWTMGLRGLKKEVTGYGPDLAKMGKAKKTITKESQNLLPLLGEWMGQDAPGMLLYGRRGQLFCWNQFSTCLLPNIENKKTDHNYNVCIAGDSGSGKSFFMQEMMFTVLGVGGKVFVLDYGRSFKKSCELLGGEHIEFDIRRPLSLNPFSNIPVGSNPIESEIRTEMLATLKPMLQVMVSPRLGVSSLEEAILGKALIEVWEQYKNEASITHIQEYLSQSDNINSQNLGIMLSPFAEGGTYGSFFSGPSQASLSEDLVVIETDHLRNHPSLMAVLVQMVILQINQTMARGDRQKPYMIIIDEAWKLLSGKDTATFIEDVSRTARKYKGSLVLGTQLLTDYFRKEAPAAEVAFKGSSWKIILYQTENTIQALGGNENLKTFVGNEQRKAMLSSLRAHLPYFSEMAIFGPDITGVVARFSVEPFTGLLFSTSPDDHKIIEAERALSHSITESIDNILERRNREKGRGKNVSSIEK